MVCVRIVHSGVGVLITERYSVVAVVRFNTRIVYVKLVNGKNMVNITSPYAPQVDLSTGEKSDFLESIIGLLSGMLKQDDMFMSMVMVMPVVVRFGKVTIMARAFYSRTGVVHSS